MSLFKEQGEFLALDLGGANFRVLLVKVMADGEQKVEMENQIYDIPEHLMRGSGTEVRDIEQHTQLTYTAQNKTQHCCSLLCVSAPQQSCGSHQRQSCGMNI